MGALRLFLAISVVVGHTAPLFGLRMMPATEAVRIFFMISGFYMALVLSGRYVGRPLLFYSNRLLRIYPSFVTAQLALAALAIGATSFPHLPPVDHFFTEFAEGHPSAPAMAAVIPNLAMIGGDLLYLLHHGASGWAFTFGVKAPPGDSTLVRAGGYLINFPAWSIGIELWFYALAPWLVRFRTRYIGGLALASLALQLVIDHRIAYSSYFFFPADLCFFLFGVLGFRFSRTGLFEDLDRRLGTLIFAAAAILLIGREFIPFFRNYGWMHEMVAAVTIPFIFRRSQRLRWDRWVGDLSYPVYIFQVPAIYLMMGFFGVADPGPTLASVLVIAIAATIWIEGPVERWRQRRAGDAAALLPSPLAVAAE